MISYYWRGMLNVRCTLLNCCVNVTCERGLWWSSWDLFWHSAGAIKRGSLGGGVGVDRIYDFRIMSQTCYTVGFFLCVYGNSLCPVPCWKYIFLSRQILSVHSPSGFNGRPLNNTFDIIALVMEWNWAPHHPLPMFMRIFLSQPSWFNENSHRWMKTIWPKVRQKSYWKWAEKSPSFR